MLNIKKHEVEDVQRSIRTSIPSPAIASTVIKIDNVNYAIKSLIANHIDESCKKLCIKTNGTILYNTDYDSMAEFDFKMLFNEIKTHNPFLIDIYIY